MAVVKGVKVIPVGGGVIFCDASLPIGHNCKKGINRLRKGEKNYRKRKKTLGNTY